MDTDNPAGKELFDKIAALLRDIRIRAAQRSDSETSGDADRATVLLQDFGVAIGEQKRQLEISLIISRKALEKAKAALQEHFKWQCAQELTMDAIAEVGVAIEHWP